MFFIISLGHVYSQNQDISVPHVVPMSPNAAELAKYADYPVSYYTGTPNISIPLYEIDVDGFKLPISLNYHASGIRVDQEATWVGLGWSLDVGSRISRTVKNADDFMMNSESAYMINGYYDAPDPITLLNHYTESIYCNDRYVNFLKNDPEPDIFYYNLPGMSGKFLLDKSRGAVLFDKSHNLKIDVIRNGIYSPVTFRISDKEGNQYLYEQTELTKTYSTNSSLNKNIHTETTKYDDDGNYPTWLGVYGDCDSSRSGTPSSNITSWCLSKITTKKGSVINFNYVIENQYLPTQESCGNYLTNGQDTPYYNKSKVINIGLRLNSITGDFGKIEFNCSERFDIKGTAKKLDSFSVYDFNNELKKTFKFDYNYFNNDYSGNYIYEHVFKRLKLNNVTEYSSQNIPINKGYSFDYYSGNFPPKNSKNVDYWGFQNGRDYGAKYYIGLRLSNNETRAGVKKDSNLEKTLIGSLKKIGYPTGGTTEFKFESNTISSSYFEANTYERPLNVPDDNLVNLPVFNNFVSDDYAYTEYPSQRVHTFEILYQTTITVKCQLENVIGSMDPTYDYDSYSTPLGVLRKISPIANNIYTFKCPFVYESPYYSNPQGIGSETTLPVSGDHYSFTLEPGIYEFEAYAPPRDVYAGWQLYIDNYVPPAPGVVQGPFNAGGIRIKEIKTDATTRKFRYPTGTMLVEPILYLINKRNHYIDATFKEIVEQVSESKAPLSTFNNGNFVGYDWVEEYVLDEDDNTSITRYNFHNESENEIFDDFYPDSPRLINYRNGLTKSIEKYTNKNTVNTLLEKDDFYYDSTYSNRIMAFIDKGGPTPGQPGAYGETGVNNTTLTYYYEVEWPLKTKEVKTIYTSSGENVVSETNYTYNAKDLLASTSFKKSISSGISNKETIEKLKYPFDFNDASSLAMIDKNMIGIPVEKSVFSKVDLSQEVELSKQKTVYENIGNGVLLPKKIQTSKNGSNLEDRLTYNRYDNNGNILEVEQSSGMKVCYIWGYKSQYPIAKIENATYSQVSDLVANLQLKSDQDFDRKIDIINPDGTISYQGNEGALRSAMAYLRNSLQNVMVTSYTYDPLIGVTSITDPKGYTTYYEYDSFNRLKQVKNQDGKVLSANEYHYKDQQ